MSGGYCNQSLAEDKTCSSANHAARCARTICPGKKRCHLSGHLVPLDKCPCGVPCADSDAEENPCAATTAP